MLASGLLGDDDITMSHTGAGLWGAGAGGGPGSEPSLSDHTGARAPSPSCAPATVAHTLGARRPRSRAHFRGARSRGSGSGPEPPLTAAAAATTDASGCSALQCSSRGRRPARPGLPAAGSAPGPLALLAAGLLAGAQRGWEGRSPCRQPQPVT